MGGANTSENSNQSIVLPIAKLFVKNLDESIENPQLIKLFQKFGPLFKDPEIFFLSNGKLRCAYIYFKFYENSDMAIAKLNNELIVNKRINVDYAFKENTSNKNAKYGDDVDRLLNREAKKNGMIK